jgi:hypothetical protein
MSDEKFGSLISFTDVEDDILNHFRKWMNTWLAARERKKGIVPGTINRPQSYIIKRTFNAIPGQEQTPIISLISPGFADPTERHGENGTHHAFLRVGIAAVITAGPEGQAHSLIGHYQAALVGIAVKHRKINDQVYLVEWTDMATDDIDDEAQSRSMAAVRLELVYKVFNFASEFPVPDNIAEPPDNPLEPQPDDPLVATVLTEVDKL